MRGEGRQVGRALAPVFEIVPRVVPLGLRHVKGFIPDPHRARPQAAISATLVCNVEAGDEAFAASHLTVRLGGLNLQPGDAERIGVAAQGQAGYPPASAAAFALPLPYKRKFLFHIIVSYREFRCTMGNAQGWTGTGRY